MSPQACWILQAEVVPRLRSAIPRSVHCVGAEDAEELVQDATAIAAKMLHSVEQQGKTVTAGNIAYYALQQVRSGRRSTGSSVVDVMGSGTQLKGGSRLHSLDEPVDDESGGELFAFHDVLAHDQEDPATVAGRNLDWQMLLTRLTAREKAIVTYLLEGKTVSDVAWAFKVSRSTMQQCKNRLVKLIQEFMGMDILVEAQRAPGYRQGSQTPAVSRRRHQPPVITLTGGSIKLPTQRIAMHNPNRTLGLGCLALAALLVLYYVWPYLVGLLATVGAVQVYRAWRSQSGRNK